MKIDKHYHKRWRDSNIHRARENYKRYYTRNHENILIRKRELYRLNNEVMKEKARKKFKKYYPINKDRILNRNHNWQKTNRDYLNEYNRKKHIILMKKDIQYVMRKRLRAALRKMIVKYYKTGKIINIQKYPINSKLIIIALTPFPDKINNYHIDHIKPLCLFDLTKEEEIKRAFSVDNLQWLNIKDSLKKGNKYNETQKQD